MKAFRTESHFFRCKGNKNFAGNILLYSLILYRRLQAVYSK